MEFMSSLQNGFDDHKPSLFELLSEQQLSSLIPPSLRYLLALATHRHPRYLLRILNSFDELHALLMLLIERHYLLTYGGGFTENFYGLKRERVLRIKGGEIPRAQAGAASLVRETLKLRDADVWKNLAIMVGLPYLKRKLDESYDIHAPQATLLGPGYGRDALPANASIKQRILYYYKWFLRRVYPSVNAAYYFSLLVFNLAYLFDSSKYHSPFLWLVGTRMRRMGEADYKAIALAAQPRPTLTSRPGARPGQTNSILNPRTIALTVYPRLLSSLKILLPTSIFALKFLEWWHASDFARQLSKKASEGLELPPPIISGLSSLLPSSNAASTTQPKKTPSNTTTITNEKGATTSAPSKDSLTTNDSTPRKPPTSSESYLPILTVPLPSLSSPPSSDLCPICTSPIQTPTASSSGYIFCYTCIHRWVEGSHERQVAFMEGGNGGAKIGEGGSDGTEGANEQGRWEEAEGSREGKWESGKGRCAVTGRRVLGGTEGLRRVMV
ncbi:MAG: ubiquitin-protein ligase peroxin 12 [Pycnora praestabilis]|nr:MAG: ubiquitin-protein ligase peroxin 12 [Pycnora praestabilis]